MVDKQLVGRKPGKVSYSVGKERCLPSIQLSLLINLHFSSLFLLLSLHGMELERIEKSIQSCGVNSLVDREFRLIQAKRGNDGQIIK